MPSRKGRARETERLVAEFLHPVFPYAERVPASLPGRDVLHTPGVTIEVKARRDLNLPAWLKQAGARATEEEIPVLVIRPDGFGEARIGEWAAVVTLETLLRLLAERGERHEVDLDRVRGLAGGPGPGPAGELGAGPVAGGGGPR